MLFRSIAIQRLGEDISQVVLSWDILDLQLSRGHLVTDIIVLDIYVLGSLVVSRTFGKGNTRLIVSEESKRGLGKP